MEPKELQKQIVDAAVERALHAHQVPAIQLLAALKEIKKLQENSQEIMRLLTLERKEHAGQMGEMSSKLKKMIQDHEANAAAWQESVEHIMAVPHLKGDQGEPGQDGDDAEPLDIHEVARLAATHVQVPDMPVIQASTIDMESIYSELLSRLKKDKSLTVSDLKDGQGFIFNGKKYKTEELMRGAGATSTGSGANVTTQYQLTSVQAGSNVTIALSQLTHIATLTGVITLYRNNIPQTLGIDFSIAGNVITVNGASSTEIFNITYSYA